MDRYKLFDCIKSIKGSALELNVPNMLMSPWYLSLISEKVTPETLPDSIKRFSLKWFRVVYDDHINSRLTSVKCRFLSASLNACGLYFWPVEPTHIKQQEPVWQLLKKRDIPFQILTNKPTLFKQLHQRGYKPVFIENKFYASKRFSRISECKTFVEQLPLHESFSTSEEKHIYNAFKPVYGKFAPMLTNLISFTSLLAEKAVKVHLVVGYDVTVEGRTATLLGKQWGFTTYSIMHGSIAGEPMDGEHIIDHFFVYGEAARKHLINIGNDPRSIVVTGAPYLDKLVSRNHQSIHPDIARNLSLDTNKPYFLVALSGPGHCTSQTHFERVVKKVMQLSVQKEWQFVSKLHRKDKYANYEPIATMVPHQQLAVVENGSAGFPTDIFEWLQGATAIITGSSTVAIEAMLAGILVITVDLMNEHRGVDFIECGATIHVTNENELEQAVSKLTVSAQAYPEVKAKAKAYAQDFFFLLDGNASERITDFILKEMKQ